MLSNRVNWTLNGPRSKDDLFFYDCFNIVLGCGQTGKYMMFFFKPGTSTMSNLTVLKTSFVPHTTTSKITCTVPRNTLSPATLISVRGYIFLVCLSILDSTLYINSEPIKCFNDPESTKS